MWTELEKSSGLQKDRGRHSVVYLTKKYAIKVFRKGFRYNFEKEVKFLRLLQPFGFVPKLYFVDPVDTKIVMERIRGKKIRDEMNAKVLERCLDICFILDTIGVHKEEMNHPDRHIIVSDKRVYFIDFERSVLTSKPANLTQFCTYLRRWGVEVQAELLATYKRKRRSEDFKRIKRVVLEKFEVQGAK